MSLTTMCSMPPYGPPYATHTPAIRPSYRPAQVLRCAPALRGFYPTRRASSRFVLVWPGPLPLSATRTQMAARRGIRHISAASVCAHPPRPDHHGRTRLLILRGTARVPLSMHALTSLLVLLPPPCCRRPATVLHRHALHGELPAPRDLVTSVSSRWSGSSEPRHASLIEARIL